MKLIALTLLLGLLILTVVIGGFYLSDTIEKSSRAENVYVKTQFGCLLLEDKYTPEQWEAREQLAESLGEDLERCN